jgi:predicted secreted protein
MQVGTALATYFLIWWVTLFAVLPWGVRNQEESGEVVSGTDPGAPAVPRLWRKLLWTTLLSGVVYGILTVLYRSGVLSFDLVLRIFGPLKQ